MSPIKVMPLFLTVITPFIMTAGSARAETPIVLAQANTQQQKDDDKHKQQQQPQQHNQQQQQPQQHGQQQPQPHGNTQTPPPQHTQQPQLHIQQGQQPLQQQPQHVQQQQPLKPQEQHKVQDLKAKDAGDAAKLKADQQKLHTDQQKIQQQQQQLHHADQQLHTDQQKIHGQQQQLQTQQHQLSAADQKAKADRAAHQADRQRLIDKEKQMAAQEKSQAAINERLKLQNERLKAITSQRHETVDAHGQKVITEPGNRTILQANGHAFIQHDETVNLKLYGGTPMTRRGPNGNSISTITRPDGSRIEIEVDVYGRPIRRVRYLPDGRRFVLFENVAIAAGVGLALGALIVSLPPVEVGIPPEQYIVDGDVASEDVIYGALDAGPIAPLDRAYSLDEVLASVSLRERMRSISIDAINFDFGSWEVGPDQAVMLETVAAVMRRMADDNPGEVFLVEGHTDAVGSDIDNLSLSDRRSQAVADVLAQQFGVPRENLVTQGYGKQFLLIPTPEPERRNRRVVIRRITPLLQSEEARYSASDGGPGYDGPR
jgi:outer membrane protein OmpA-like peptidoglycan-associated protein